MIDIQTHLIAALHQVLAGNRPRIPEAGMPLWCAFLDLTRARTWYAHGPNPITFPEIMAYTRLMRLPLAPHHVEAIRAMDDAWLEHMARKAGGGAGRSAVPQGQRQAITPQVFDAVFG